jgi:hypothetical protein
MHRVFKGTRILQNLRQHPLWLTSDTVLITARLSDGNTVTTRKIGHLPAQFLTHHLPRIQDHMTHDRLKAILRQAVQKRDELDLMV